MFLNHKELDFLKTQMFYKGVIEDNDDPQGFGRVRVRVLGLHNDDKEAVPVSTLPWASIARSLDFGGLKAGVGLSSIPQIGTWVYLFFEFSETGQYDKPVIIGAISGIDYGSKSLDPDYMTKHTIRTPMNHVIQIDDANAEIKIQHSTGTFIKILRDGSISIDTKGKADIKSTGKMTLNSSADTDIISSGNVKVQSAGSITLQSASSTMVI